MANDFFSASGAPATGSQGSSATMRAEFASIEDGFDKLPALAGNGGKVVAVNSGGTALEPLTTTGTGSVVKATSPTLVTPTIGVATATSINGTTIPSSATLLTSGGALGTPSSGTVTNLTGTASININGTVGATTPNTGAFTTVTASGVFTGPDGSASAPSYSFSSSGNSDNGMYLSTSNELSWSTSGTKRLTLTSDGRLYGTALHNNAGAVTGTTNQYIASGTYTPTLTNVQGTSSLSEASGIWMRVGNVVTMTGRFKSVSASSSYAKVNVSLPIASNFSEKQHCFGFVQTSLDSVPDGTIFADTANDQILASYVGTTIETIVHFSATYIIL